MRIVVCPNAFKHSVSAEEAAHIIIDGLQQSKLACECIYFPIGDGGDGTGKLIVEHLKGTTVTTKVHDALGNIVYANYGMIEEGRTAVIEMAAASGISILQGKKLDAIQANSFGTGEQIIDALNKGVQRIIIALGGSATTDAATGMLQALGVQFLNEDDEPLQFLPQDLVSLKRIDVSKIDARILNCEVVVLCDVNNYLLGEQGAAAVFAPQKGATKTEVQLLERCLEKFAAVVANDLKKDITNIKHGGAAGGAAAGLYAFTNATLMNGIDDFLKLTNFNKALQNADIIITGEGSIDQQTLNGKGPFGVAQKAKQHQKFVIGLAGNIPSKNDEQLSRYFDVLLPINNKPCSMDEAIRNTPDNLFRTAFNLGNLLAMANI